MRAKRGSANRSSDSAFVRWWLGAAMLTWDLGSDGSRSTIRLTIRPVGTVTCILYLYDLRIAAGGPNVHRHAEVIGNETGEEDILAAARRVAALADLGNVGR